jgi:hypothetical protein
VEAVELLKNKLLHVLLKPLLHSPKNSASDKLAKLTQQSQLPSLFSKFSNRLQHFVGTYRLTMKELFLNFVHI